MGNFYQVGKLDQVGYFDPLQTLVGQKLPYPTPSPRSSWLWAMPGGTISPKELSLKNHNKIVSMCIPPKYSPPRVALVRY